MHIKTVPFASFLAVFSLAFAPKVRQILSTIKAGADVATIRRVGSKWRAEVRKKGVRESKYFDSKMRARAWAEAVEARAGGPETLGMAFERYADTVSPEKKGARWEQIRLAKLGRYEIASKQIAMITAVDLAEWRDLRLREVSAASVRRELGLISAVFQKAVREWHWCDHNPAKEIDKPSDHKPRDRRITDDEIERVLLALGYEGAVETKQHQVAVLFLLAIETAMRLGEMCSLMPENILLKQRYVRLIDTKNGDAREVPLSKEAVRLLSLVPGGFTVTSAVASTLFRRACINAKIKGLRFHDTRREALTRLSKKVGPFDLAKISGHRDIKTLLRVYYSPSVKELAALLD